MAIRDRAEDLAEVHDTDSIATCCWTCLQKRLVRPLDLCYQARMRAADGRSRYTVQVLLPCAVQLDPHELHDRLREWRADVELLGNRALFAVPTNDLPLLVHVFPTQLDTYADALCDALTWSPAWRWDELARR